MMLPLCADEGLSWWCCFRSIDMHARCLSYAPVQALPNLRHLDMTGCSSQLSLLCKLHEYCPQLESLRMGKFVSRHSQQSGILWQEKAAGKAVLQRLPRLSHDAVQESWEDEQQLQVL